MAEILHILSPRIDRAVVCDAIGVVPKSASWNMVEWKDGKAKMRLEAIEQPVQPDQDDEFAKLISGYTQLFEVVAEGEDLKEINRRLLAARWILRITATPGFDAAAEDSNSIANIATQLDGTCITDSAVIDPASGDAILAWDD